MAINQNHLFEELDGIKCAIVEKNASASRVEFLRRILEYNRFTVVVIPSPPAKAVPSKAPPAEEAAVAPEPAARETFTIGVTDVTFNPVNAVFGRLLKLPGGHVVTLAYWNQQEETSHDEVPYFNARQL